MRIFLCNYPPKNGPVEYFFSLTGPFHLKGIFCQPSLRKASTFGLAYPIISFTISVCPSLLICSRYALESRLLRFNLKQLSVTFRVWTNLPSKEKIFKSAPVHPGAWIVKWPLLEGFGLMRSPDGPSVISMPVDVTVTVSVVSELMATFSSLPDTPFPLASIR